LSRVLVVLESGSGSESAVLSDLVERALVPDGGGVLGPGVGGIEVVGQAGRQELVVDSGQEHGDG